MSEWITINMAYEVPFTSKENDNKARQEASFCYHPMHRPGVQFELQGGARYLIGDMNGCGGNDGEPFLAGHVIVTRARVVFDPTGLLWRGE